MHVVKLAQMLTMGTLVAGCVDFSLSVREDRGLLDEGDDGWVDPDGEVVTEPPDEICNGVDDDGDGAVDEGHPDLDGDGIADCVDRTCDLEVPPARDVPVDPVCTAGDAQVDDPWDVRIEWQWTGIDGAEHLHNVVMTPVIGNLTDSDLDGDVDVEDVPDVVAVVFADWDVYNGALVVLAGDTGHERWNQGDWNAGGGIALADVDSDGATDIVGFTSDLRVRAVAGDGTPLWTSTRRAMSTYPQATVADLDGDGRVEVLADGLVLDGRNGDLLFSLPEPGIPYRMPAVGDLDRDGAQEIIFGNAVYDSTGTELWSSSVWGSYGHWSAIFDADGDLDAEVAMVGGGRLGIYDHDGAQIVDVPAGTAQPGAPCVADFDGDGDAEIAWASGSLLNAYELDGTARWTARVDDSSGLAACSGYDVNGDGAYEVLYADQGTFYIFDGRTGAVRYQQSGHASGTLWEYPSVADVDRDESAEIVIGSNNGGFEGWGGITVFGHDGDGWMRAGTTWHTHDFAVTNINPDGTVPAKPDPWWTLHNVYRARPADDRVSTDLMVDIVDLCFAGCEVESPVRISVQIHNVGKIAADPGVPVTLYTLDGAEEIRLETVRIPTAIPPGQAMDALVFEVPVGLLRPGGLLVRVDDAGTGVGILDECDEENNEAWWADSPCE